MSNISKQILFVGEAAAAQEQLRSDLAQLRPGWRAAFSPAGAEALTLLGRGRFDAVVADDSLPDMKGCDFLSKVQDQHPHSHRLIVCPLDPADAQSAVKTTRLAHGGLQCVPKPWDSQTIAALLERTFALALWLSNATVRGLVQRLTVLPSPPTFYFDLVRALRTTEVDLEELAQKAEKDPALTAKLLQVSNSAALGLRHKVARVQDAINFLGLETTRSLILLAHTFSYADKMRTAGFSLERLWKHSLEVAALARRIAKEEGASPEILDEAFLAGLLHDIGKLLLAVNLPDDYSAVIARVKAGAVSNTTPALPTTKSRLTLWRAEIEAFGATHAEVGAELMATWNLPLRVVEALALHHRPAKLLTAGFSPLVAVHAANAFVAEFGGRQDPTEDAEIDLTFMWDVGVVERLDHWKEICRDELSLNGGGRKL